LKTEGIDMERGGKKIQLEEIKERIGKITSLIKCIYTMISE